MGFLLGGWSGLVDDSGFGLIDRSRLGVGSGPFAVRTGCTLTGSMRVSRRALAGPMGGVRSRNLALLRPVRVGFRLALAGRFESGPLPSRAEKLDLFRAQFPVGVGRPCLEFSF